MTSNGPPWLAWRYTEQHRQPNPDLPHYFVRSGLWWRHDDGLLTPVPAVRWRRG